MSPLKRSFLSHFFITLTLFSVSLLFSLNTFADDERLLVIHGKVVNWEGAHETLYVVVEGNRIVQLVETEEELDITEDTLFLYTDGYIFPGFIDLHTHMSYNILPLWDNAQSQFKNRYEWRDDPDYTERFKDGYKALKLNEENEDFYHGMIMFDELQAIGGGTTLVQQSGSIDQEVNKVAEATVVRGTGYPEDLYLEEGKRISTALGMFYQKNNPDDPDDEDKVAAPSKRDWVKFTERRAQGTMQAYIPHMAEGRTGFLRDHDADVYTEREFEAFMNHPAFQESLLDPATPRPPIALIHGSGVIPSEPSHIDFLHEWNMGLVWSPVSNLLLYGDTLDVESFLSQDVPMALGSDWSPSGSKHVLDEARFAKFYLNTIGANVADEEIYQMVTSNPAEMIGLGDSFGQIEEGFYADIVIFEGGEPRLNGMDAFFNAGVENIALVMIDGRAVYGDRTLLEDLEDDPEVEGEIQLLPERERDPLITGILEKSFYVDPTVGLILDDVVTRIEDYLKVHFDVKRSNTLSVTDKPYNERIEGLKLWVEDTFG